MRVHVKHLGCINRPEGELDRFFHTYLLQADNGAVAVEEDEDLLDDGFYEMPDEDWVYDENKDYGEDLVNEKDLLGSTTA